MDAPDDDYDDQEQQEIVSRKGYLLKDLARNYIQCLGEAGPVSAGKLLHFTADMVASGGLQLWQKLCWDYSYEHIGVASPRIFHFLKKQFRELNELSVKLPQDTFCRKPDIQIQIMEIPLILQTAPKKSKPKIPTIPQDTHENEQWLRSVLRSSNKMAVRKVWSHSSDMDQMLHAGNEMVYAITEGATERAIFWARWLIEEDALYKKKFGAGLTTMERGPPQLPPKQKTAVGYYLINILAEVYKEFAEKGMVRMHEEFQALLDIYRSTDFKITQRRKMDTMALMIQILTDVPRWKIPAAPSLVPDPTQLNRASSQASAFFEEVLRLPIPPKPLPATVGALKQKKVKEMTKQERLEKQLELQEKMMMDYYKI